MITTPTTFVIGAGASQPHGLPLGYELFKAARGLAPRSNLYQLLRESGIDISMLNEMCADMNDHPAPSIDAYLLTRQTRPGWVEAGRAMIAVLMADASKREKTPAADEDWLGKVYGEMSTGAATWKDFASGNASVRFVTFNFDSIVESRLQREIGRSFRDEPLADVEDFIKRAVVHVHGTLPPFPSVPIEANVVHDLEPRWIKWAKTASTTINIIHDECDGFILASAQEAIRQADILCFLGFAYHVDNTKRLDLQQTIRSTTEVFGSAYKIADGDRPRVTARVGGRISLGDPGHNSRQLLEQFHIFRD